MEYQNSYSFAQYLDERDPLRAFRRQFHIPIHRDKEAIYFCGNSLGLQPKSAKSALLYELNQWKKLGVKGHFEGEIPWVHYHKNFLPQSAHIVGAKESETIVMNTLTVNLHLMMVSFYRPTKSRFKIIMEGGAFPSDQYAVESQVRFHGYDPQEAIIEVMPREGEFTLRTEDIVRSIERNGNQTALVLFGGMNYFTGQLYDLEAIVKAGHQAGAVVGFDLAHVAGNIPVQMHAWDVDFAVWCSYKYLNSGPGGPGGVFIHERHFNTPIPRFAGWWGYDEEKRFLMEKGFIPMAGAAGWQLSNAMILGFAAAKAGIDLHHEAGMPALRQKSILLTGFMEYLIRQLQKGFHIITPEEPSKRGCQLSIHTGKRGKKLFQYLSENGVICDWREDNLSIGSNGGGVIRVAPVPMYNTFREVYRFAELLGRF